MSPGQWEAMTWWRWLLATGAATNAAWLGWSIGHHRWGWFVAHLVAVLACGRGWFEARQAARRREARRP